MGAVIAIGDVTRVGGLALVGVRVFAAQGPDDARRAWRELPADADLVILDRAAASALADTVAAAPLPLVAVLP